MNQYALTQYGEKYLKNRYVILGVPSVYSSIITNNNSEIGEKSVTDMELIDTYIYECKLIRLNGKLIFRFKVDEIALGLNFKSMFLGFKQSYDSALTPENIEELKRLIYIDPDNLYNGIITQELGEESIVNRREKGAQLQYGINSIILDDIFDCTIIPDEEITCDISELSTGTQVHNVYPYYENL